MTRGPWPRCNALLSCPLPQLEILNPDRFLLAAFFRRGERTCLSIEKIVAPRKVTVKPIIKYSDGLSFPIVLAMCFLDMFLPLFDRKKEVVDNFCISLTILGSPI